MADVYAQARALVKAVRESPEWQKMRRLAAPVKADPTGEQLLSQLRLKQLELQATALRGQEISQRQEAELKQVLQQIQARPALVQYMEAETAYGAVLAEVQQVLLEVFHPDVPGQVKERLPGGN